MTTDQLIALLRAKGGGEAAEVLNRREEIADALERSRPPLSPEDARRLAKLRAVCGNRRVRDPKDERQDEFMLRLLAQFIPAARAGG